MPSKEEITIAERLIPFKAEEQMLSSADLAKLARATRHLIMNKTTTGYEGIQHTVEQIRCRYPKAFF